MIGLITLLLVVALLLAFLNAIGVAARPPILAIAVILIALAELLSRNFIR